MDSGLECRRLPAPPGKYAGERRFYLGYAMQFTASHSKSTGHSPLRITIVCTVPTTKSGIPAVIFNLLSEMDRTGLQIHYVSINPIEPYFRQMLEGMGVTYSVIPRQITHPFRYIRKLAKAAEGSHILHAHGNSATMVLEMIAAKRAGVPLRIAHGHSTSCNMKLIDKVFRKSFYTLCNGHLACSEASGHWLFGTLPFKIINNAIDTARFRYNAEMRAEMRRRLGVGDAPLFGHVGNFLPVKNHSFIIDVFAAIAKDTPEARLILVGEGELMKDIRHKVDAAGLSAKVIFTGSVPDPENYLQAMDAVIMPSLYEGFPLSVVEQQANGLPVLASARITPQLDMTGNVTFLPIESPAAQWADTALRMVHSHHRDAATSTRAIESIRNHGFDLQQVAADLKTYYITESEKLRK